MSDTIQTTVPTRESTDAAKRQEVNYVRPWYRVAGNGDGHVLHVAMPGVSKAGVQVSLEGDDLTITGHRQDRVPEGWKPVFEELPWPDYRLRLRLNVDVDADKISAHVEDGMLTLTLPVREEAKPRSIAVN